jgi:uncharacterized membrane protein
MKTELAGLGRFLAVSCISGCLLSGCAWSIGGARDANANHIPTRGEELIDLKKARDQGAISEEEYRAQKNKLMSK